MRRAALAAMTAIEEDAPLAPVRAGLASTHADIRTLVTKRLPGLRQTSPLVPGLVAERLSDDEDKVRLAALDGLYELSAGDAVEPVRIAMQRGPADIRAGALLRLARAHESTEPAGAALVAAALDDPSADVRRVAFLISVGARPNLAARARAFDADTRKALAELEKPGRFAAGLAAVRKSSQEG